MERTRTGIIASIIDFIRAFKVSETDNNGRVTPEELSKAEREELKKLESMGKVRKQKNDERDEFIENLGPIQGNPIHTIAQRMNEREQKGRGERE